MNDVFERKCIYDADMYESSWESTEDANGNSRFACQDYESTKIQLDYGRPISIDLNVWPRLAISMVNSTKQMTVIIAKTLFDHTTLKGHVSNRVIKQIL